MQLHDLIKPLSECSDEELLERLRKVRHNREVTRPVAAAKVAKTAKKASNKRVATLDKLVDSMTPAQREALIKSLMESSE